jgi:acyl-CoA synthetase (AMP-forming)/AMP-acid ligase II
VIGVPDLKWGETVCALVVLRTGEPVPTAAELIEFSKHQIASYKKPRHVVFIESLPKLVTGKVDKKLLREQYAGQEASQPQPEKQD